MDTGIILIIYFVGVAIITLICIGLSSYSKKKKAEKELEKQREYEIELEKSKHQKQTIIINNKRSKIDIAMYILLGLAIVGLLIAYICK